MATVQNVLQETTAEARTNSLHTYGTMAWNCGGVGVRFEPSCARSVWQRARQELELGVRHGSLPCFDMTNLRYGSRHPHRHVGAGQSLHRFLCLLARDDEPDHVGLRLGRAHHMRCTTT